VNMLSTLGLLLAVVLGCAYVLKRTLNARMMQMNESSVIKILERRSLNPKSIIYLIEVEGEQMLVGESSSGLHPLGSLQKAKPPPSNFSTAMSKRHE